jgi:hypothetical protein
MIQDPDSKELGIKFDSMTFKFTPRVYKPGTELNTGDLGDTKFELLEYKHNDAKALLYLTTNGLFFSSPFFIVVIELKVSLVEQEYPNLMKLFG